MTDNNEQRLPAIKAAAAWSGTGLSYYLEALGFRDWGDVAAFLAAVYTILLIGEWLWKRIKRRRDRD